MNHALQMRKINRGRVLVAQLSGGVGRDSEREEAYPDFLSPAVLNGD